MILWKYLTFNGLGKIGDHKKWLTYSDHMPIFTSFQE
jgi:hypothetical protein